MPSNGYDNRPDLNALLFRDGFYDTGDVGKIDADGKLVLLGRKQSFVYVGGYKVDTAEVEEVLESHPAIRHAAVLGVETSPLGAVLKAVLVAGDSVSEAALLGYCRERLAPFKIPRHFEFRETLPRSPLGKVLKSEFSGVANPAEAECVPALAPEVAGDDPLAAIDRLAERIREQAALCLQRDPASISRTSSFAGLGFDSLRAAELHRRLVPLTGAPISITALWNYPSIDALATMLARGARSAGDTDLGDHPGPVPEGEDFAAVYSEIARLSDDEVDARLRPERSA